VRRFYPLILQVYADEQRRHAMLMARGNTNGTGWRCFYGIDGTTPGCRDTIGNIDHFSG
jgi:hypothetical protein